MRSEADQCPCRCAGLARLGPLLLAAYARRGWLRLRAGGEAVAEPPVTFAALLRKLRAEARLTQEELAEAARLSPRSVSDLERGIATVPRRETVRLRSEEHTSELQSPYDLVC